MRAFVDRIDEEVATLLLGEDESVTVSLPVAWLPGSAREGMVLQVDFQLDPAATGVAQAETQSLLDSLGNNP